MAKTWTNWVGNQSFTATDILTAYTEAEVTNIIKDAASRNLNVRVAGSGHSFTPVVETDGIVLDPVGLNGIRSVDESKARVTLGAATTIKEIGEPLWNKGFSLRNQGDIEAQRIAGAIATGTHGSGTSFGSFSASMVGCRLATASGEVINIDESTPDLLAAAQVSVGTLGVMTDVTMQVSPRYRLQEDIRHETFEEVMSNYQENLQLYIISFCRKVKKLQILAT
jgi:FAD/FMN-containing dehydrogenase